MSKKKTSENAATKKIKLAIICGGPSGERGISLNSARSACDHLDSPDIELIPIYIDLNMNAYKISRGQLYCNTPSDFDFKLQDTALKLTKSELKKLLRAVDVALPVIHGDYGEDGQLQKYLEEVGCPFVGPSSEACKCCFDKAIANDLLEENNFYVEETMLLEKKHLRSQSNEVKQRIKTFFKRLKKPRAIIKPAVGGSSLGVYSVSSPDEAFEKFELLAKEQGYDRVVLQPFCEGTEFTVIMLENRFGLPVALPVIEIETDYSGGQIFDYRKKYLATTHAAYHCPARYPAEIHSKIQAQAEQIFALFGMKGFARFDGWLLPDGNLWFFDFNPISGMEQNSFLFIAATQVGMTHADLLRYVVKIECDRQQIPLASAPLWEKKKKKPIHILFGGDTAERQVSLMSGTNVWLKLRQSSKFDPVPHLLDQEQNVWRLPYAFALKHTVEEITQQCKQAQKVEPRRRAYATEVLHRLAPYQDQITLPDELPQKMSLKEFVKGSKFVFNTVHGGIGENGEMQELFAKYKIKHNGSNAEGSRISMDKYRTGEIVTSLGEKDIRTAKKVMISLKRIEKGGTKIYRTLWQELLDELGSETIIVKPPADGCSAGIVRLYSLQDLKKYCEILLSGDPAIPAETLTAQKEIVEMPTSLPDELMFEEFIITDEVRVVGHELEWQADTNWVEVTVGVLGKKGKMKAMNPSITIASGDVLSLEEKFQGGTGVNITPPPAEFVSKKVVEKTRKHIARVANALGIGGYSRIDSFMNIQTGEVVIIEANTLPGLTGSTVIFHQALAENPPMYPREFLEEIVALA